MPRLHTVINPAKSIWHTDALNQQRQPSIRKEVTMKFETIALHAGFKGDPTTKAATTPIYQTTSYTFDDTQHGADLFNLKVAGNIYTRIMNPTNSVLEERMTALEGGVGALAVASGMSAITYALQTICRVGNNIVSTSQLYGGTYNLFRSEEHTSELQSRPHLVCRLL